MRFYCDYCKCECDYSLWTIDGNTDANPAYLTHDATSVRKNHLSGKNHVKHVCDYYEDKAKELGLWRHTELPFEITSENLYAGIPPLTVAVDHYKMAQLKQLPPPPTLQGLPQAPPRVTCTVPRGTS